MIHPSHQTEHPTSSLVNARCTLCGAAADMLGRPCPKTAAIARSMQESNRQTQAKPLDAGKVLKGLDSVVQAFDRGEPSWAKALTCKLREEVNQALEEPRV